MSDLQIKDIMKERSRLKVQSHEQRVVKIEVIP
jgi:hypothetical protein